MVHEKDVAHKACGGSNARDRENFRNSESVSFDDAFEQVVEETGRLMKDTTRHLCNQLDIQRITENILHLRQCQISVQEHLTLFSNDEFMRKQRNLINDYQLLLLHEKDRLYDLLKSKYALNVDEIINIEALNMDDISLVDSGSRYSRTCSRTRLNQSTPDLSSELPAFKVLKYTGHNNARIPSANCTDREFRNYNFAPIGRSDSYRRAIEQSESLTDRARIPSETENKPEDKLTEKDVWPEETGHEQKQIPNSKANPETNSTEVKKTKIGKEKNKIGNRNHVWRRFFCCCCPWQKFQDPIPLTDDICEACKLNHKAM